jgi:hypothetical protein
MTLMSRVRRDSVLIRATAVALAIILGGTASAAAPEIPATVALEPTQQPPTEDLRAALKEFERRLDAYIQLRSDLSKKVKPLASTADSAELTARQEALAAALRIARSGAKKGDLIPAQVAAEIQAIVAADFKQRTPADRRATVAEVPSGATAVINRPYPQQAALPTVPPLLLSKLPVLPDNLQYRFVGPHMVILDGDTQLIIDYVANAVP